MRASQYKNDFNTLKDKIDQLKEVLIRLGRSGLDFKPDVDTLMDDTIIPSLYQQLDALIDYKPDVVTVMDEKIIPSLNQKLYELIDFVSKLLSDYSLPSYDQVAPRSLLGRLFAFRTVLNDIYSRLVKLDDPTRQVYVGSPPPPGKSLRDVVFVDYCEDYNRDVKQLSTGLYNYIIGDDVKTILQMGDAAFKRDQFISLDSLNDFRHSSSPALAIPLSRTDSGGSSQSSFSSGIDGYDSSSRTDHSRSPSSFFSDRSCNSSPRAISSASSYEYLGSDDGTQFSLDF